VLRRSISFWESIFVEHCRKQAGGCNVLRRPLRHAVAPCLLTGINLRAELSVQYKKE
jgi:hypothetical protein